MQQRKEQLHKEPNYINRRFYSPTSTSQVFVFQLAMYVLRLGIVTIYLSSHMVSGYTCGAAFHVLTSQVAKLLGQDIPRKSGVLSLVYVS